MAATTLQKVSERHNQAKLKAESKCDGVKADSSGSVNHFPSLYQVGNKEMTQNTHTNISSEGGLTVCWSCSSKRNACWLTPGAGPPR